MSEVLFTPAAVLSVLTQIDELQDKDITLVEGDNEGHYFYLEIGESKYELTSYNPLEVEVPEESYQDIAEVNDDAYQELADDGQIELDESEPVEGGIIKQALKTLLIGGLVRLTSKLLK